MADPPPFPFSGLHFNGALTSLVPEVVVGNDLWPSDVDLSEASVDKSLQLKISVSENNRKSLRERELHKARIAWIYM